MPSQTEHKHAQTHQPLDKNGIRKIQQIVSSILYYARAVDMTVLVALSSIASEQMRATEKTQKRCVQLLDYLASNSEAKVRYRASDMIMNIHSDASYLSEPSAQSRTCGSLLHGIDTQKCQTNIYKRCILCKHNNNAIHCCVCGRG